MFLVAVNELHKLKDCYFLQESVAQYNFGPSFVTSAQRQVHIDDPSSERYLAVSDHGTACLTVYNAVHFIYPDFIM